MLKALNQFIFTLSILGLFPVSAQAADCGSGMEVVKAAQPNYPRRAKSRGIEGQVKLEFTISTEGDVKDIVIIESEPKGVFDRISVRTIGKFKFTPCITDGAPVEVNNVRQTFVFSLGQ